VAQPNEENPNPIGDETHSPVSGIVHRLSGTGSCSSWCMSARCIAGFVFRREMVGPGKGTTLSEGAYNNALAYIRAHSENLGSHPDRRRPADVCRQRRLSEVIGGPSRGSITSRSSAIHSRVPVAEPQRINDKMVAALRVKGATTWVALHANHIRELTPNARRGLRRP